MDVVTLATGGGAQAEPEPGADRLDLIAAQVAIEILGQRLGGRVALGRVFLQALEADRLQLGRDPRAEPARRDRLLLEDRDQRLHHRPALVG